MNIVEMLQTEIKNKEAELEELKKNFALYEALNTESRKMEAELLKVRVEHSGEFRGDFSDDESKIFFFYSAGDNLLKISPTRVALYHARNIDEKIFHRTFTGKDGENKEFFNDLLMYMFEEELD